MKMFDFVPPWWLRNAHVQTLLASLYRRRIAIKLFWQRMELPDGDFLDLAWDSKNYRDEDRAIVVLLHGLGGSVHSSYSKGLMQALSMQGYRPVFMHFRGASGTPNRLARNYHAGETEDLAFIIKTLQKKFPNVPLKAIGVSLGGNVLLKWLGETGPNNPLVAASAISVPFDLVIVANRMMSGMSKMYQSYLLRKIKRTLRQKIQRIPYPVTEDQLNSIETFWQFDNLITAPLYGFKNAEDYYKSTSCRPYLSEIKVPTLIIHAKDDPFMTPEVIPEKKELSDFTQMIITDTGGHVGFFDPGSQRPFNCWYENHIPHFFKKVANEL